ncbi:MAG: FadR family transcriptional regulator [Acidobacteria bacterium]|nr:FadR family transcriptional regulator [Acidobacteriota bacterium]
MVFEKIQPPENLHDCVTRNLAQRVIQAERSSEQLLFPNEAGLCEQLGVSRSILRESIKVLADKGLVEVRPRSGMRSRPRAEWNLLDPDILGWQAELEPDVRFLRDLCEVRLAMEPTASGFAAVRATAEEIAAIENCLELREAASPEAAIDLDLQFQSAVVEASHNSLFQQLNASIRKPFRTALSYTVRLPAAAALDLAAHRTLLDAIRRHDPMAARAAAEEIVGYAMLAVEQVIRTQEGPA